MRRSPDDCRRNDRRPGVGAVSLNAVDGDLSLSLTLSVRMMTGARAPYRRVASNSRRQFHPIEISVDGCRAESRASFVRACGDDGS